MSASQKIENYLKAIYKAHLVQTATTLLLVALGCSTAAAQSITPITPASSSSRPFEILDNSFLVEEAFNQPANVFQNIFGLVRTSGSWEAAFTQEWPVGGQTHQFSFTMPLTVAGPGHRGLGDVLINYRFQAMMEKGGRPAFSPRLSLILPTGSQARELGAGAAGLQINLPFSRQAADWYFHWNAGFTWLPGVEPFEREGAGVTLTSPHLAASAIWRARPLVHLMLESVLAWEASVAETNGTMRERAWTVSPGVRAGWNLRDRQLVLGLAAPTTVTAGNRDAGVFLYLSYELPFRR